VTCIPCHARWGGATIAAFDSVARLESYAIGQHVADLSWWQASHTRRNGVTTWFDRAREIDTDKQSSFEKKY
jgi:hypothetical protein